MCAGQVNVGDNIGSFTDLSKFLLKCCSVLWMWSTSADSEDRGFVVWSHVLAGEGKDSTVGIETVVNDYLIWYNFN